MSAPSLSEDVSVVVTASPIPSHPSTEVIDACLASVREYLPDVPVFILCDGIREGMEHRTEDYALWLNAVKADVNVGRWGPAEVVEWGEHQHQARMVRHALHNLVQTPLVLSVEHDTPLCGEIPFDAFVNVLHSGELTMIRLLHEAHILEPHQWLTVDREPIVIGGVPVIRTAQFSARPSLIDADYFRWLLGPEFFNKASRTHHEDVIHGVLVSAWKDRGLDGWQDHRVAVYAPEGDMKRSLHTDGRGDDPKLPLEILPLEAL